MSVRSSVSNALREMLRRSGREVVPYDVQHFPDLHRRRLMQELGINVVLDVGANMGQTGEELRAAGYTAPVTSLEDAVSDYVRNYLVPDKRLDPAVA